MTTPLPSLEAIPVAKIDEDPAFQVRRHWDPATDASLEALAASLAGPEGLIHPVSVVPLAQPTTFGRTYALIAGHRRLAAARRLGWRTIPARVLPACDLSTPLARLHLLAIAVRENTEREDLLPADRRAALLQLEALYTAVYPETTARQRPRGVGVDAEAPAPFPRWAAKVTQLSERTIRRDLRAVLLAGRLIPNAPVEASVSPATPSRTATCSTPMTTILDVTQQAITAWQSLVPTPTVDPVPDLPQPQRTTLQQALEALQAVVTAVRPVVQVPTAPPVLSLALVAQAHLTALHRTLHALRTVPPAAWATLPPAVAQQVHTTMATLLTDWHALTPYIQEQLPDASVVEAIDSASPSPWGRPMAMA